MDKEETKGEPAKPVMKGGEGNLPLHKNVPVVLFDERGGDKEKEKDPTYNARPPDEVVAENCCGNLP